MRARVLLQVAEECRKAADAARQKLVAPEIGDGTKPKRQQALLTTWFSQTSDTQATSSNPFHSLRGRSGPVQPCCQTMEERKKAMELAKLLEANKRLKAFSEEKATEAAKAFDLYNEEINYTHAAVREMRSHTPQDLMHEQAQVQIVSVSEAQNQPHSPQPHTPQGQAVSAGANAIDELCTPEKLQSLVSLAAQLQCRKRATVFLQDTSRYLPEAWLTNY